MLTNGTQAPAVTRKKLIEVALPLESVNAASAREKSIRHGHPSTLHLWWARRPLAAARAVIFAQMVDDPSSCPEEFPTVQAQEVERKRLFRIIDDIVIWDNSNNQNMIQQARDEIWRSWRRACADNRDHPRAADLFNPSVLPALHDPFAGGGTIPLEAQRLGLVAFATDLNPVAVFINKAMIEIPPRFAGRPPVNPEARGKATALLERDWSGGKGLADDVRYYGGWIRNEAEARIGHLFPKVEITPDLVRERPDLAPYAGRKLTVISWIWARTVHSPNPAFAQVPVPLAASFVLSAKDGKQAWIEPVVEAGTYRFSVKIGAERPEVASKGTKAGRATFACIMSGTPIPADYIKREGKAGRLGTRLMAVIAEGDSERLYVPPTEEMELAARQAQPDWTPAGSIIDDARAFTPTLYGLTTWTDLFTKRQMVALGTFTELIQEAHRRVKDDICTTVGAPIAGTPELSEYEIQEYADAVAVYLACAASRAADYWGTGTIWEPGGGFIAHVFSRNALAMTWDFPESNPFSTSTGNWSQTCLDWVERFVKTLTDGNPPGISQQADARTQTTSVSKIISTDPPYYDNIPYADLSDYFYVWLRKSMKAVLPDLFATLAVPKAEELVASPYRHDGKSGAETFFLNGMTQAMDRLAVQAHPAFPITIYYAFKQSEADGSSGTTSTGWETFLGAVVRAGLVIDGTWPIRTERPGRMREFASNALASSIVLVCRRRAADVRAATRSEFLAALRSELPPALFLLQRENIAPVDLAQAAIGPGMAVFTRYSAVLDADGKPLSVRQALSLINQTLDEALTEQEGDFDGESRWALVWFEQTGFAEGDSGIAETLASAKNTSLSGLVRAGILSSASGRTRLLRPHELTANWDPVTDSRLTAWETLHHIIRALDSGELAAAGLVARLGPHAETARELCYRLYTLCERKKWATEAQSYNSLVLSWPEITRLAQEQGNQRPTQVGMFESGEV